MFDKYLQEHLEFQEDMKQQAFKLLWKMAAKEWRQFRFSLRRDFIRKGQEPFVKHPHIALEEWDEFVKMQESDDASAASNRFKELRRGSTNEHSMGPAGYSGKQAQWEKEDNRLAVAGIHNPYDDYPDNRLRNLLRARSRLEVKDGVAEIIYNKEKK